MSDMTEYELHSQGGVIAMSPKHDGRDPMRNRPHSNGTDTTMTIQRYGLGREYAGNTGSPAITEQADGAYVRYEDHQRMEAGYKNHNDLMVLRTKKAEDAQPSGRTNRDYAIEHAEYLAKAAERFIEAVCSHSQAVMEHDEQDTMETAKAADDAAESTGEAMTSLRSMIYEFRKRRDRAATPAGEPAKQDAEKVECPTCYGNGAIGQPEHPRDGATTVCPQCDGSGEISSPVEQQPDPAMAGDDRAEFEAAYIDHGGLRLEDYELNYEPITNRYLDDNEQSAWWAWQESRKRVQLSRNPLQLGQGGQP